MGAALSISPVLGLVSGGLLAEQFGYLGSSATLMVLAALLLLVDRQLAVAGNPSENSTVCGIAPGRWQPDGGMVDSGAAQPAGRPVQLHAVRLLQPGALSVRQAGVEGERVWLFRGSKMALATLLGSLLNKRCWEGWQPSSLIRLAVSLALGAGCWSGRESVPALVPAAPRWALWWPTVSAIPNVLSQALQALSGRWRAAPVPCSDWPAACCSGLGLGVGGRLCRGAIWVLLIVGCGQTGAAAVSS